MADRSYSRGYTGRESRGGRGGRGGYRGFSGEVGVEISRGVAGKGVQVARRSLHSFNLVIGYVHRITIIHISCKNNNFAWRTSCNRCQAEKPKGASAAQDSFGSNTRASPPRSGNPYGAPGYQY
ncbi:hypothetical protein RF11_04146 [Thelohanellus kitauei]|uniref:Uncharacterized protein n=1 Tax=Thelohanellus kitauei TaxID=669202 RepID=A0A0C2JX13_THEKT|nr:hypothetical protein RF11_04146 [Thelohanellus kitauei]